MASGVYNRALYRIMIGDLDLGSPGTTLKVMLLDNAGYTFDPDHDYVSSGAGTVGGNEIPTVASYTGGYGGSGRQVLAKASILDDTNNNAHMVATDLTWAALDDGTVGAAVIIEETGGSDATSYLVAYIDNAPQFPIATNGGDITIEWPAGGIIVFSNA